MSRIFGKAAVASVLVLGLAASAGAEIRTVRGIGAAPGPGSGPIGAAAPRESAMRAALWDAVHQVAESVAPGAPTRETALGDDPLLYLARYRIVEDRGEGPRTVLQDPGVATEVVVVVEAAVDVARVREALEAVGGRPALPEARGRVFVVLEAVPSWRAYEAVQAALAGLPGVESATPVEFHAGRAVLAVQGGGSPQRLMDRLVSAAAGRVELVPLGVDGRSIGLRVARVEAARPAEPVPAEAVPADAGAAPSTD